MSFSSSSTITTTTTDSTSDASGSLATGYISIPRTNSSLDDHSDAAERRIKDFEDGRHESLKQHYRGQLRLDVNVNHGYMTIHVIAARNLITKRKDTPNVYVEATIIPYSPSHEKCVTFTYYGSTRPVFDKKMSMELPPEAGSKRLIIAVRNSDTYRGETELIGYVSFGLHRMNKSNQLGSGWYYILNDDIGLGRHVKIIDDGVSIKSYSASMNISKILLCKTSLSKISSGPQEFGYGFTLKGLNSVGICNVVPESSASFHGLQKNDTILFINNVDVTNKSAAEAAGLVRNARLYITMVVKRNPLCTVDRNEDKMRNGIVAKFIKMILKNKLNKPFAAKNFTLDNITNYGWVGDEKESVNSRGTISAASVDGNRVSRRGGHVLSKSRMPSAEKPRAPSRSGMTKRWTSSLIQKNPGINNNPETHRNFEPRYVTEEDDAVTGASENFMYARNSRQYSSMKIGRDAAEALRQASAYLRNRYEESPEARRYADADVLSPVAEQSQSYVDSPSTSSSTDDVDVVPNVGDRKNERQDRNEEYRDDSELTSLEVTDASHVTCSCDEISAEATGNESRLTSDEAALDNSSSEDKENYASSQFRGRLNAQDVAPRHNYKFTSPLKRLSSLRRNKSKPLTPLENIRDDILNNGMVTSTPMSNRIHFNDSPAGSTPQSHEGSTKRKALFSRIKTVFKNKTDS